VCQRCGQNKQFYFNSRKQRGSGKTRGWIKFYNVNKSFTRTVSGLGRDFKCRYHPQDLCDDCIDILLGWAWKNIKPVDPYWSPKIFIFNDDPFDTDDDTESSDDSEDEVIIIGD
jgi:hypothetical protein